MMDQVYEDALSDPNFLERTRYDWTVPRIRNAFAEKEILFLFYEGLFTGRSLERLCQFLQIKHVPANADHRLNVSVAAPLDPSRKHQLRAMFAPVYDFVDKQFGDAVPAQWRDAS